MRSPEGLIENPIRGLKTADGPPTFRLVEKSLGSVFPDSIGQRLAGGPSAVFRCTEAEAVLVSAAATGQGSNSTQQRMRVAFLSAK